MSSPLALVLANIFMGFYESKWLNEYNLNICLRYILLVCFLSLNESTSQTRKNIFHFTSKALFVLEKIEV